MDAMKEIWKDPKKKHKFILGASAFFSFVMSIYSFVNCMEANNLLQENAIDYGNVILNWEAKPLLDARVVRKTDNCPKDYVEGIGFANKKNDYKEDRSANTLQTVAVWPGTLRCVCEGAGTSTGRPYIPKEKKITGCTGGSKCTSTTQCTKKQLKDGCKHKYTWVEQPQKLFKDTEGKCDTNRLRAGCVTEDYNEKDMKSFKGQKICYKRGGKSALERPQPEKDKCPGSAVKCGNAKSSGVYCAEKEADCPITALKDVNAGLGFAVNDKNERPIIEVRMTQGKMCEHGAEGWKDRNPYPHAKYNNDNPCYNSHTKEYEPDTRYVVFDSTNEDAMFTDNSVDSVGKTKMPAVQSKDYETYRLPTTISADETPVVSTTGQSGQSGILYYLSYRRELLWSKNCSAGTMKDLKSNLGPVKNLAAQQSALVGLNGFFGLFILGIVFPITTIMFIFDKDSDLPCVPGSGEEEEKNIKKAKSVCGTISKIAKFIPLILAYSSSGSVMKFFSTVGSAKCSDDVTNDIFSFLGIEIGKINQKNQNTLVADVLMLIVTILTALYSVYKARKKKNDPSQELSDIKVESGPRNTWAGEQKPVAVAEVVPTEKEQLHQIQQQNLAAQGFHDADGDGIISQDEVNRQIQMQYEAQMKLPDQDPNEVSITVPKGYGPGKVLTIKTASGKKVKVKIPDGKQPGMAFKVNMALLESVAK